MEGTEYPCAVTQDMIDGWKKKYPDVWLLSVKDRTGKEYNCFLRKPDRSTLAASSSFKDKPIKASEVMLQNCWLAGDEEIKTNDELFMPISKQLGELIDYAEATIKKL